MKKRILAICLVVALAATAIVGASMAYLTDTDSDVNVMTLGNVQIEQTEVFEQGTNLYPGLEVQKEVTVENTGKSEAYIRTLIAFEKGSKDVVTANYAEGITATEAEITFTLNDVEYELWYVDHGKVAPGTSVENLQSVTMSAVAINEDMTAYGDLYEVLVLSQAVQTEGFASSDDAYTAAFGSMTADTAAEWFSGLALTKVTAETTYTELAALLEDGNSLYLTESIKINNGESGNTYLTVNDDVKIFAADGVTVTFPKTTLINGTGSITVYGGSLKTDYELCVTGDSTLVFEGGEHTFGAFSATGNGKIVVNDGVLNCKGTYAGVLGISFAENGQLIVNGGTLNMDQPFNLNADRCDNAYVEINGGTINLSKDIDKLFAVRNIMAKDRTSGVLRGSSIRITGGVFTAPFPVDSTGDANAFIRNEDGNADTTRVLESNTYNGEKQYDCVVTGGTFYGDWMRTGETGGDGTEVCENTIAGFVADGYDITGDSTNGYVVSVKS